MQKSTDYTSASAYAIILTKGFNLLYLIFVYDIKIIQHAPSLILDAFAEVIVPFLSKAGFNWVIMLYLYLWTSWSFSIIYFESFEFI